ncbi:MAG: Crp/Fnr family transcriptional regulator [Bacteroidales bacterium]
MEDLINSINREFPLEEGEITILRESLRTLSFSKGGIIIRKGDIDDSIYFIRKGVWRAHLDREGEELTIWFAIQGEIIFSSWGHIRNQPSRFSITASCDSTVIEMKRDTIERLSSHSINFNKWLHKLYVDTIFSMDDQIVNISYFTAEQRYLAFMKKKPSIFQQVPLKEIAGFIGVTPQSLSRIRANLKE